MKTKNKYSKATNKFTITAHDFDLESVVSYFINQKLLTKTKKREIIFASIMAPQKNQMRKYAIT